MSTEEILQRIDRTLDRMDARFVAGERRWEESQRRWEEDQRRWEADQRRWEADQRRWEERDRRLQEQIEENRRFNDALLERNARITAEQIAQLTALQAEIADQRAEIRAGTQALLRVLDRLPPAGGQG